MQLKDPMKYQSIPERGLEIPAGRRVIAIWPADGNMLTLAGQKLQLSPWTYEIEITLAKAAKLTGNARICLDFLVVEALADQREESFSKDMPLVANDENSRLRRQQRQMEQRWAQRDAAYQRELQEMRQSMAAMTAQAAPRANAGGADGAA